MPRPKISVVIPTYNVAHLVVDAIDSALAQTLPPDEVIVVDDGSTDDTSSMLAAYGDRIRYIVQKNAGASAARNHGIREAQGDYIAFLDADDIWHPRKLELQCKALEKQPELGILASLDFDWPADAVPVIDEAEAEAARVVMITWERMVIRTRFSTPSTLIKKTLLDALGGFDTSLKSTEDRDLWVRIGEIAPVGRLAIALVGVRQIEGSLSRQTGAVRDNMLRMLRKVDARGAWRGRFWLRRKAFAFAYFAISYIDGIAGRHWTGLFNVLKSIATYPLPFSRDEVTVPWSRPKRLVLYLLRALGFRRAKPENFSGRLNVSVALAPAGAGPVHVPANSPAGTR